MLNSNHPDEERLSALASGDSEATADLDLSSHVSSCDRCADVVGEVSRLRAALAELPDLRPSRPLQLVPVVANREPAAAGIGGWVRRLFGPALAAGAAMALVGVVGTASPALDDMASGQFEDVGSELEGEEAVPQDGAADGDTGGAGGEAPAAATDDDPERLGNGTDYGSTADNGGGDEAEQERQVTELPAERSPWPMVLFTGVALMIGAVLLRWILVPRGP